MQQSVAALRAESHVPDEYEEGKNCTTNKALQCFARGGSNIRTVDKHMHMCREGKVEEERILYTIEDWHPHGAFPWTAQPSTTDPHKQNIRTN